MPDVHGTASTNSPSRRLGQGLPKLAGRLAVASNASIEPEMAPAITVEVTAINVNVSSSSDTVSGLLTTVQMSFTPNFAIGGKPVRPVSLVQFSMAHPWLPHEAHMPKRAFAPSAACLNLHRHAFVGRELVHS